MIDAPRHGPDQSGRRPREDGRRLDVAWCAGCGRDHGMGHCPRAVQLTEEALRRHGPRFNWR